MRVLHILFFVLCWFVCVAQTPTFTVYALNDKGENVGHITFKPDFQEGYTFYHLENLGKEPFNNCTFIADEKYEPFIKAYFQIICGADFALVCMDNELEWGSEESFLFFPTLIRAACSDCELPKELIKDVGESK